MISFQLFFEPLKTFGICWVPQQGAAGHGAACSEHWWPVLWKSLKKGSNPEVLKPRGQNSITWAKRWLETALDVGSIQELAAG